jgi:hypothetical protein
MAIAASWQSLALKSDGSLWVWGRNDFGVLGLGTLEMQSGLPQTTHTIPQQLTGLSNIRSVAATGTNSFAVGSDGTAWAWGRSHLGPFGQGAAMNQLTPKVIDGLPRVVAIAGGGAYALAHGADGAVWGWGLNNSGQLGTGELAVRYLPTRLSGIQKVEGISAGNESSAFLLLDSTIGMAGSNRKGQLGDGTFAQRVNHSLVVNTAANGFLSLNVNSSSQVSTAFNVPFFVSSVGGITDTSASVSTATKFNASDKGKSGAVFVTAVVPPGTLGNAPVVVNSPKHVLAVTPPQATATSACPSPTNPLTLVQLTPTGWQTVVNGQLLPYASGVLGDQLAAQTILNNADTTNLKGAEFCVGYGTSAEDMVNNGNIRAVATIPGATTTSTCVVGSTITVGLNVTPGWNLLGNPINQSIAVASKFGDANKVSSVWKWDTVKANWQFYSPGMDAASLQSYVTSQGYGVLVEISPGDGYWVHAKVQADLDSMCGTSINLRQSSLSSGWNLVSTASPISAKEFNLTLSMTPPTAGQVPINMTSLWAWDANQSNWYFYAPSLDAQGGSVLSEYISRSNYKDFNNNGKTLGNGVGIWVNRP